MTKDALESLRKRHSKYVSDCYYRDWLLAVACVDEIAAALEQAWAERDAFKFAGEQAMGMGTGLHIMEERDELKHKLRACEQERDELKQALAIAQKNLDDTFGNMLEAQEERDALKAELQAWRDGGLTEEILRRNDGTIKVGSGCRFVYEQYIKDTEAEITALRAELDDLKRQHKDCREQKEALRERAETLELGYRGFP